MIKSRGPATSAAGQAWDRACVRFRTPVVWLPPPRSRIHAAVCSVAGGATIEHRRCICRGYVEGGSPIVGLVGDRGANPARGWCFPSPGAVQGDFPPNPTSALTPPLRPPERCCGRRPHGARRRWARPCSGRPPRRSSWRCAAGARARPRGSRHLMGPFSITTTVSRRGRRRRRWRTPLLPPPPT